MIRDVTASIRSYLTTAPTEVRIISFPLKSIAWARRNHFSEDNTGPFCWVFKRESYTKIRSPCFSPCWPQQTPPALANRKANTCSLLAQPHKGLPLPQPHIPAWLQHSKWYFKFLSQSRLLHKQEATLTLSGAAQLGNCPLQKCPKMDESNEAAFL